MHAFGYYWSRFIPVERGDEKFLNKRKQKKWKLIKIIWKIRTEEMVNN